MFPFQPQTIVTKTQVNPVKFTLAQELLIRQHRLTEKLHPEAYLKDKKTFDAQTAEIKADPELATIIIEKRAENLTKMNKALSSEVKAQLLERIPTEPELANLIVQEYLNAEENKDAK